MRSAKSIRSIVLVMPASNPPSPVLRAASVLAHRLRARLDVLCTYSEPAASPAECYARGTVAVRSVVEHIDEQIVEIVTPAKAAFDQALRHTGLSGAWCAAEERDAEDFFSNGRTNADLAILPIPRSGIARRLAEFLLLKRALPCLLAPDEWGGECGRVLIAWDGSEQAKHGLEAALPLLRESKAARIVIVGDPRGVSLVDAEPAAASLRARAIDCDILRYSRHPNGDKYAIVLACEEFAADLLVMGAYGHSRVGEAILGGVTRRMLGHAPVATFMAHEIPRERP